MTPHPSHQTILPLSIKSRPPFSSGGTSENSSPPRDCGNSSSSSSSTGPIHVGGGHSPQSSEIGDLSPMFHRKTNPSAQHVAKRALGTSLSSLIAFHKRLSLNQRLLLYFLLLQFFLLIVVLYFHLICPLLVVFHQKVMSVSWIMPNSDSFAVHSAKYAPHASAAAAAAGEDAQPHKSKVAFVFTHPDDESMFFSPAIRQLLLQNHQVYMLCFTTNFNKFMKSPNENRADELERAVRMMGVEGRFKVLEPDAVEQGAEFAEITAIGTPGAHDDWFLTPSEMQQVLNKFVQQFGIEAIVTFDKYGVSGHPEHLKVRNQVLHYQESHPHMEVFELITYNKVIKFSGLIGSLMWRGEGIALYSDGVEFAWNAMVEHVSQWVWFRKFFIANSRYAYLNNLRKVKPTM
mmetsp:Transcript_8936/g.32982  ORF Transcript_8936/g.32982 Transcript_8936/m.32982 type:complete len:403 (+) Transcript_8936:61-1269(+)